jgi:iron complex transport system permease protein
VNYRPGRIAILSIAVSLTLGSILVFPFLGYAALGFADIWESTKPGADIFWHLRLPRVLVALLTGSALAAAGTVTQALLRNPLATPYTLGIASGSVFGAILGILTGWGTGIMLPFFAVAGAMAVLALLNGIVFFRRGISTYYIILIGITITLLLTAVNLFIQFIADFTQTRQMLHWLLGGIRVESYPTIAGIALIVFPIFLYLLGKGQVLNIVSVNTALAYARGIDYDKERLRLLVVISVLVAVVVGFTGPIGFIGLIVPHILRMLFGSDFRIILPLAMALGGFLLSAADALARTVMAPVEIPVGVFTAMLGGVFMLVLFMRNR